MGRDFIIGAIGGALAGFGVAYAVLGRRARAGGERPRGGRYYAGIIGAKAEFIEQYMQLHDATWAEVMERMYRANMRDFVVWLHEETNQMFHQFCYVGDDFEADMASVAADPIVRFWWTHCEPCQAPLHWKGPPPSQGGGGDPSYPGQWWSPLKQVNHCGAWATAWSDRPGPNPAFVPCHPRGLTSTKDRPPPVHNRPSGWTSYTQTPPG